MSEAPEDEKPTSRRQRVQASVTSSGFWHRVSEEAAIPVTVPRWFLVLRALSKTMIYGLVVAWVAFIPLRGAWAIVLWSCVGLLWVTILAATVIDVRHARRTEQSHRARLSDITMLLAPLPALVDLPALCIILLVAGYIMQLRRISAGQAFMFALFGSIGAILLGTIALIGAESVRAGSELAQPINAIEYTAAKLFRLTSVNVGTPETTEGEAIGTILQIFSAIFLGALYGGLLAFVVKDSKKKPSTSTTDARLAYVIKQQQEILRRLDSIAPPATKSDEDETPKSAGST